jgi:hypothetical protein
MQPALSRPATGLAGGDGIPESGVAALLQEAQAEVASLRSELYATRRSGWDAQQALVKVGRGSNTTAAGFADRVATLHTFCLKVAPACLTWSGMGALMANSCVFRSCRGRLWPGAVSSASDVLPCLNSLLHGSA